MQEEINHIVNTIEIIIFSRSQSITINSVPSSWDKNVQICDYTLCHFEKNLPIDTVSREKICVIFIVICCIFTLIFVPQNIDSSLGSLEEIILRPSKT